MTLDTSYNYLPSNTFQFIVGRLPNTTFYVQRVGMPSVSAAFVTVPTPGVDQSYHADKITYGDLNVEFIVDEDMKSYIELFKWILQQKAGTGFTPNEDTEKPYSDGKLLIMTSSSNPNITVTYKNCFPVSLGEIEFSSTENGTQYATCTATFKFSDVEFGSIPA